MLQTMDHGKYKVNGIERQRVEIILQRLTGSYSFFTEAAGSYLKA